VRLRLDNLTGVWVLVAVNVMFFIAGLFTPNIDFLVLQHLTFTHHPWTLVTSMFLHGSITHIFFNMVMLYFYGSALIQIVGEGKFLILYFIAGIVGNLFFIALSHPFDSAIGASGAVMGLGAALAVLIPRVKLMVLGIIEMDFWIYIMIGSVLLGIVLPFSSPGSNIAWQAHLGGFITGLAAGYLFRRQELGKRGWY
jgi:membrane associated rhomboid family serine protease